MHRAFIDPPVSAKSRTGGWQVVLPLIFHDIYILYIWRNSFSVFFFLIFLNLQNIFLLPSFTNFEIYNGSCISYFLFPVADGIFRGT